MSDRLDHFELLLDRLGPATECWPPAERELARDLLARDPRARALLAEAQRLDALLRDSVLPPAGPLPAPLAARLASIPAAEPRARPRAWWLLPSPRLAWSAGAAALAASAALGFLLATGEAPPPAESDDDYVALASIAFGPQLEPDDEQ
jgi:hypothetical protein